MTPIIRALPEDERAFVLNTYMPMFLDGLCYEFTLGMHGQTDWPMYGLYVPNGGDEILRHAVT